MRCEAGPGGGGTVASAQPLFTEDSMWHMGGGRGVPKAHGVAQEDTAYFLLFCACGHRNRWGHFWLRGLCFLLPSRAAL